MKTCECGCTKETHFMKDGACYGFITVEGVAQKCPCLKFKKRSRRYNNQSPHLNEKLGVVTPKDTPSDEPCALEKDDAVSRIDEGTQSQTITPEEFEEWTAELKEAIHNYLTNKGSFKISELEEIIDKKVEEALE